MTPFRFAFKKLKTGVTRAAGGQGTTRNTQRPAARTMLQKCLQKVYLYGVKKLSTIVVAFLCAHCTGTQNDFGWLKGTWKMSGREAFEVWDTEPLTKNLVGKAFRVQGSDTVVTEEIRLEYYNGSFHYIPDVSGDQGPVDFTVTQADNTGFVAENASHDFPKMIRYRYLIEAGRPIIEAAISGDGKVISFSFEKIE